MRVHLRRERTSPSHTTLRLFMNGGSCGVITMTNDEALALVALVTRGAELDGHSFQRPEPVRVRGGHDFGAGLGDDDEDDGF